MLSNSNYSLQSTPNELSAVHFFLERLCSERYFGRVELSFQSGKIVNIRQEQSLKPQDLVANSKGISDVNQSI